MPNRQVPRPFVQTTSYLPCEINRPNLRKPAPTATPAFRTTSRPVGRSNDSKVKPIGQKIDKDKPQLGPYPHHLQRAVPKASRDWSHRANSIGTSQAPIFKMVQCPHSMRLPWRESRSSYEKLHCTQIQGPRSDQCWKIEVWGFG